MVHYYLRKSTPKSSFYLQVDKDYKIWVETMGKDTDPPLFLLHGGPMYTFDLKWFCRYIPPGFRLIYHHQRGCGKSRPLVTETRKNNTTKYLIKDIEKIRKHFGYKKIFVDGWSWGSSLSLFFALKHPDRVAAIVVGAFGSFDRVMELSTKVMAPDVYSHWKIGKTEKETCKKMVKGLLNPKTRRKFVKYASYEEKLFKIMKFKPKFKIKKRKKRHNFKEAVIGGIGESLYYGNLAYMPKNYIIKNAHKLNKIPGYIISPRFDIICTPLHSYLLSKKWKRAKLLITEMSGHGINTVQNYNALQEAYKGIRKYWKKSYA